MRPLRLIVFAFLAVLFWSVLISVMASGRPAKTECWYAIPKDVVMPPNPQPGDEPNFGGLDVGTPGCELDWHIWCPLDGEDCHLRIIPQ